LRDVTQGNNGDFDAVAGWDACTGLGSPNGSALTGILKPTHGAINRTA
jgi:kumamolisin